MKALTFSKSVTIVNPLGLHARPAGRLVVLMDSFDATLTVKKRDQIAEGDSVLDLMMLRAGQGEEITLKAEGPEAEAALEAVVRLVNDGFGEIME